MILVLGKYGQVATELRLLAGDDFFFTSREEINLLAPGTLDRSLAQFNPSLIINCTAYNNVDAAETDPTDAILINTESIKVLARYAQKTNCPVIHISTDFVFDGTAPLYGETAVKNPLNKYGKTKSDGEDYLLDGVEKLLILRTSWVYSNIGSNFLTNVKRNFLNGNELYGAEDIEGSPTRAYTIARFIYTQYQNFLCNDFKKIYHLCDSGSISRHAFVSEIVRILSLGLDLPERPVNLVSNSFFKLPAMRPMQSGLDNQKLRNDFSFPVNDWAQELLEEITRALQ